jgi:hypothetical protein
MNEVTPVTVVSSEKTAPASAKSAPRRRGRVAQLSSEAGVDSGSPEPAVSSGTGTGTPGKAGRGRKRGQQAEAPPAPEPAVEDKPLKGKRGRQAGVAPAVQLEDKTTTTTPSPKVAKATGGRRGRAAVSSPAKVGIKPDYFYLGSDLKG